MEQLMIEKPFTDPEERYTVTNSKEKNCFKVHNLETGKTYVVNPFTGTCTCPDFEYHTNNGSCKHIDFLRENDRIKPLTEKYNSIENEIEVLYEGLANTIRHDQGILEFKRRFCNGKLGHIFQIPDYDNPTPEEKTDAILTNDRNKLGKITLGKENHKTQFKYRCPTTYFTVGIKRNHVRYYEKNNIAVIFCIPKTSDISYYDTSKSVNTKEHHFFLWIPNHPKWKKYQYDDVPRLSDIYFPLRELREILDFELLEKDQSILTDFGGLRNGSVYNDKCRRDRVIRKIT